MSALQGGTDDKAVIEIFKEALKQRIGQDVYQAWFGVGVEFQVGTSASTTRSQTDGIGLIDNDLADSVQMTSGYVLVEVRGQFALDRLSRNYSRELRGAAMQAFGRAMEVRLQLAAPPHQVCLPIDDLDTDTVSDQNDQATNASPIHSPSRAAQSSDAPASGARALKTRSGKTENSNADGSQTPRSTTRRAHPDATSRSRKAVGGESIASLVKQSVSRSGSSRVAKTSRRRKRSTQNGVSLSQPTLPNLPAEELASQKSAGTTKANGQAGGQVRSSAASSNAAGGPSGATADASASGPSSNSAQQRMTLETFVGGKCNQLARTAAQLVCETPQAGSPLFISGPPGVGKTHLLFAISHFLRRHHRMRRVMHLSAEKFTNDFVRCLSEGTLTSFRSLYRDIDALIIDDVQFFSGKKATLREMLYTVESLMDRGKTLIFAATHSPNEISGLTQELSGRMSSGLVCTMQTLDSDTRATLLRRCIDEKCLFPWPEEMIIEISKTLPGDGRRISGFVNLVSVLQRMNQRMPTMAELYEFGGDQLRSDKPFVTLAKIERAVAQTFQLDDEALQSKSQARTATEPRMLAMYLSRELTPAAFAEIGRFYGGRSHSAAILARRRVEDWLASGKAIGRGSASLSARDALDRIESLLRSG